MLPILLFNVYIGWIVNILDCFRAFLAEADCYDLNISFPKICFPR